MTVLQLRSRLNRAHPFGDGCREFDVRYHPGPECPIGCRPKELCGAVRDRMLTEHLRGATQGADARRVVAAFARFPLKLRDARLQVAPHEPRQRCIRSHRHPPRLSWPNIKLTCRPRGQPPSLLSINLFFKRERAVRCSEPFGFFSSGPPCQRSPAYLLNSG